MKNIKLNTTKVNDFMCHLQHIMKSLFNIDKVKFDHSQYFKRLCYHITLLEASHYEKISRAYLYASIQSSYRN